MTLGQKFAALPGNVRGAAWLLAGGLCFTVVGVLIKLLGRHLDSFQIAFFRSAIGLAFMLPILLRYKFAPLRSGNWFGHFWRAALGTSSMVVGFYAVTHLALADATAIGFSTPLFVIIVAVIFLGEKVRWRRWTATAAGFVGVLVMMRPGHSAFDPTMLVAIGGAFLTACSVSVVKKLTATEGTLTMLATFSILSTIFTLVPAMIVWRAPTLEEWAMATFMGLVATVGQAFIIRAYSAGDATAVTPFDYLRLPFSGFAGFYFFGELPDLYTLAGVLIIVGSTLYIARREARLGIKVSPDVKSEKIRT
jgi:drug/metabolite transporter (DMT)-like permease